MPTASLATGLHLVELAAPHVGERYVLGTMAPKNNPNWKGPWDCAEFISWLVYQASGKLYGCQKNSGDPARADAYTGYWSRDAKELGKKISVSEAARIPGAAVLRMPSPGSTGHIVLSDGTGRTIEAHSTARGLIRSTLDARRWDTGILVPWIDYTPGVRVPVAAAPDSILRLRTPRMTGPAVTRLQRALTAAGFDTGGVDGMFGTQTHAAVAAFQRARGLVVDGEAGPDTMAALKP